MVSLLGWHDFVVGQSGEIDHLVVFGSVLDDGIRFCFELAVCVARVISAILISMHRIWSQ